jgi:hypothetical protein
MRLDIALIDAARALKVREKSGEQGNVGAGRDRQMDIGDLRGRGGARIDDDDFGSALLARRDEPLEQDRVAPGEIRADQHDEVGELEILIEAGHGVRAEGAAVPGDG